MLHCGYMIKQLSETILKSAKQDFFHWRWKRSLARNKSPLDPHQANIYTSYLKKAQGVYKKRHEPSAEVRTLAENFLKNGFTSLWTDESQKIAKVILEDIKAEEAQKGNGLWDEEWRYKTDDLLKRFPRLEELFTGKLKSFLESVNNSHFKLFYGVLYKSVRDREHPWGSQLWHCDGGPGTCINLMFCLSDVYKENGAMECLPWEYSQAIQEKNRRAYVQYLEEHEIDEKTYPRLKLREIKCDLNKKEIAETCADKVQQPSGPPGMLLPFRNNILHKGGFPEAGHTRYVFVFHVYPSVHELSFAEYKKNGFNKKDSYPKDPAFGDQKSE